MRSSAERERARGLIDELVSSSDRIDQIAQLIDGVENIHEHGLVCERLSAEIDLPGRNAERQRIIVNARERGLTSTTSTDIPSLIAALMVAVDPPPGSTPGRAAW